MEINMATWLTLIDLTTGDPFCSVISDLSSTFRIVKVGLGLWGYSNEQFQRPRFEGKVSRISLNLLGRRLVATSGLRWSIVMNSFYLRGIHISPRSIAVTRTLSLYCPQHRFLSLHPSLIARKSPLQQSLLIKRIPAFRQLLPLASMLPFHLSKQYSTSPSTSPSTTPTPPTPPSKPTTPQENHENIYTIPNILTFTRLAATPVIAYLILHHQPYLATGLLLYAGLTDLVDGWIARKWNLKSVVGTIIDPMADKFLMISLTGSLAWTGQLPRKPSFPKLSFPCRCRIFVSGLSFMDMFVWFKFRSELIIPRYTDMVLLFWSFMDVNLSLAGGDYSWTGFRIGNCCFVLSMDITSSTKDYGSILGFFITLRRSSSYYNLKGQESSTFPIKTSFMMIRLLMTV